MMKPIVQVAKLSLTNRATGTIFHAEASTCQTLSAYQISNA